MSTEQFITSLKKTGTHPLKLVPDPRTEKYLKAPIVEGKKLVKSGEIAIPLLERIYRFALCQVLIDYANTLDMRPFEAIVEAIVDNEVAYAKSDIKERKNNLKTRRELLGKLIAARKQCTQAFDKCKDSSMYIKQFRLMDNKIGLFAVKKSKDAEILSSDKLIELIAKTPELRATHEELNACVALAGRQNIIDGYIASRQRLLGAELTKGNVLHRILVENFDIYISNLVTYRLNQANPVFNELVSQEGRAEYFKLSQYPSFISQEGIDEYNGMINGTQVVAAGISHNNNSLNKEIREYNAQHAKEDGYIRMKTFKPLYKQILGLNLASEEGDQIGFQIIANQEEFIKEVEKWISWYDQIDNLKQCIGAIDRITNLDGLYIRQNSLGAISKHLFDKPMELRDRLAQIDAKPEKLLVNDNKVELYRLADLFNEQVCDRKLFSQYFDNQLKTLLLEGEERSDWTQTLSEPFAGKLWLRTSTFPALIASLREAIANNKPKAEIAGLIERFQLLCSRFIGLMRLIVQEDGNTVAENPLRELIDTHFMELMENTHYEGTLIRSYLLTKPNDQHKTPIQFKFGECGAGWSRSNANSTGLFIVREPSGIEGSPYYYHLCVPNRYLDKPLSCLSYQEALESNPVNDGWGLMRFNQITANIVRSGVLYNQNILNAYEPDGDEDLVQEMLDENTRKNCLDTKDPEKQPRVLAFVKRLITTGLCKERYHFDPETVAACQTLNDLFSYMIEAAYVLDYAPFDHQRLEQDIEDGRIFRFKIETRKLYKPNKRRSPHEQLFLAAMRGDQGVSLQGGVKIFYREPRVSPEQAFVHKKGTVLLDKYDTNGQSLVDENGKSCYKLLLRYLNKDNDLFKTPLSHKERERAEKLYEQKKETLKTKVSNCDIVQNARYTRPQWTIHLPLQTNRTGLEDGRQPLKALLNQQFDNAVRGGDYRVLSLRFSTRNLIYLTLIDANGKVIEQRSLNQLSGHVKEQTVDYFTNIQKQLKQITQLQRDLQSNVEHIESTWGKEDEIKGMRDGYISLIVSLVASYMRDGKTLLVMEDARDGLRGTQFNPKQITAIQRLIIAKLACLRLRDIPWGQPGSINKPISLVSQVNNNMNLIGRNGMMYIADMCYINSRVDHTTGFINLIPTRASDLTVKNCKDLIESFDDIHYDSKEDIFKFTYTPSRLKVPKGKMTLKIDRPMTFTTKEADCVVFNGRLDNGMPNIETWDNITDRFKNLFDEGEIPYDDGHNLIPRLSKSSSRSSVHKAMMQLFKPLLRMDNYDSSRPKEEGYYSAAEGGIRHKYPNAIDEAQGYVLALRGLAYIYYYLRHAESGETEDFKLTLEDLAEFFEDFASLKQ